MLDRAITPPRGFELARLDAQDRISGLGDHSEPLDNEAIAELARDLDDNMLGAIVRLGFYRETDMLAHVDDFKAYAIETIARNALDEIVTNLADRRET